MLDVLQAHGDPVSFHRPVHQRNCLALTGATAESALPATTRPWRPSCISTSSCKTSRGMSDGFAGVGHLQLFSKPELGSNFRTRAFSLSVRTSDSSNPSDLMAWMSMVISNRAPAPASRSMTSRVTFPISRE